MSSTKRFKTIYLHVGLGKTGSTSIQQQILANAELLESRYDLHFPRKFPHLQPFEGNHSILLRAMFSGNPDVRKKLAARGLETEESIEKYNKQTVSQLLKSFDSSRATKLFLSAEGVGHFRKDDMLGLANWLRGFADEVKILACVRHPLQALSSEIQQRLTIGAVLEDLYEAPPYYRLNFLFERLELAFGRENIIAYDFAEAATSEQGLAAVLLRKMGVEVGADFSNPPPANSSMSHEAALLISALNRQRPVLHGSRRNPLRKANDVQQMMKIPGRKFLAPPHVYDKVVNKIQSDIDWLKSEYQIDLGVAEVDSERDYYSFSEESIDNLALEIANYARLRYAITSPFRFVYIGLRRLWSRFS